MRRALNSQKKTFFRLCRCVKLGYVEEAVGANCIDAEFLMALETLSFANQTFFELVEEVKEQGKPIDLICETFLKCCRLANEVFWIVDNLAVFLLIRISHLLW